MRKCVRYKIKVLHPGSRPQAGKRSNCAQNGVSAITYEVNLLKLHKKIKPNEKGCHS